MGSAKNFRDAVMWLDLETNCRSRGNGKGIQRIPLHQEYMREEILSRRGSESQLAYSAGEGGQSYFVRDLVYILRL